MHDPFSRPYVAWEFAIQAPKVRSLFIEAIEFASSTNVFGVTLVGCTRWLFRQYQASDFTPPNETLTITNRLEGHQKPELKSVLKSKYRYSFTRIFLVL